MTTAGDELRMARLEAGLTRIQLAALAGVSFSQLSNIEQGAVPKRSAVLKRALAAISALNDNAPGAQAGREVTTSAVTATDHAAY
ncbi:MAG: Helix-turn-helix domain [Gaiellaceae bacterium]|jgi:transcriptional regulator with XRE-family HTH domain|nr:Helix-turn-helix domain [Gaiellaceae bacterium]